MKTSKWLTIVMTTSLGLTKYVLRMVETILITVKMDHLSLLAEQKVTRHKIAVNFSLVQWDRLLVKEM